MRRYHSILARQRQYIHRRVWFISICAYIPTAREVGLIIQDALNKQVKIKWVWLTLHVVYT